MAKHYKKDTARAYAANENISAETVRVVDENGAMIGIIDIASALERARAANLDLVEVSPNSDPPVCKIMNFGKFKYRMQKREHESRRKTRRTDLKEVRLRPKTDKHDLEIKLNHARKFLEQGHRVQFTMLFRGRETAHTELGRAKLNTCVENLADVSRVDMAIRREGRRMLVVLGAKK